MLCLLYGIMTCNNLLGWGCWWDNLSGRLWIAAYIYCFQEGFLTNFLTLKKNSYLTQINRDKLSELKRQPPLIHQSRSKTTFFNSQKLLLLAFLLSVMTVSHDVSYDIKRIIKHHKTFCNLHTHGCVRCLQTLFLPLYPNCVTCLDTCHSEKA